jgi:hypothetical protein
MHGAGAPAGDDIRRDPGEQVGGQPDGSDRLEL